MPRPPAGLAPRRTAGWEHACTFRGHPRNCSAELLNAPAAATNRMAGPCYDAAGNLLSQSPCPASTYTYDAENRMLSTAGVTYTYDADGRRIKKSNGTAYWFGPGGEVLAESDLTGTLTAEYAFLNGKRVARRDVASNALRYYFADHLGSATVITDANGNVIEESDFYPYGGERVIANFDPNRYKFTGQERDSDSGLDNFGARMYSSAIGRFTTPDPLASSASPALPQTWNRYAYAINNPLKFIDPTGKCSAPAGIQPGQVGICIGSFISAKRIGGVGLGDNRGPVGNNSGAKFKSQTQLVVDPSKGSIESAKTDPGKSSVEGLGRKGTASSEISQPAVDENGNMRFSVSTTATNGLSFLPGAPKESIDLTINFVVTPEGKVGIDGGTRDAYPSLEVFAYDSQGNVTPVLFIQETKPGDLAPPEEQKIPRVKP